MNQEERLMQTMKAEGLNSLVIDTFLHYYHELLEGKTGKLSRNQINKPADHNLIHYQALKDIKTNYLDRLAVIKLNGGLGTGMGLKKAKSLLPVKGNLSFLDIIIQQILCLRNSYQCQLPLIFMNSFNTRQDSLEVIDKYPDIKKQSMSLDFVQNKFPKIRKDNFEGLKLENDTLNWNPPGHGDIYSCLNTEGIIDELLDQGIHYLFISNADNLGAQVDLKLLTYMADHQIPFIMEVCERTEMDKKGGHLAQTFEGQLILREIAQCPDEELLEFQNISLYHYFNTNNLWIDIRVLKDLMQQNGGKLFLPLIVNPKKVEEIDVYQLETAMGSAISLFEGAKALCVPRDRFVPVKKTQDLLMVWSDIYELDQDFTLRKTSLGDHYIELEEKYYGLIEPLLSHFPEGAPSLKDCHRLKVSGNIVFGKGVVLKGDISLKTNKGIMIEDIEISNE